VLRIDQPGLRVQDSRASIDVLVIDWVEQPSPDCYGCRGRMSKRGV